MPRNFFVTGMPKAGKTTILHDVIKGLKKSGLRVGGFISPSEKHHGTRTAFHVMDIETGKEAVLADVHGDGPKISKYHVNIKSFERVALPSLKKCRNYDVIIVDEIGRMEMKSNKFSRALDDVLDAEVPLIASLSSDYVDRFTPLGEVLNVGPSNRQAVYSRLLQEAKQSLKPKKKEKKPKKKKPKKAAKKPAKKKKEVKKVKKKAKKTKKKAPKKSMKKMAPPPPKEEKKEKVELEEKEPEEKKGFFGRIKDSLGI